MERSRLELVYELRDLFSPLPVEYLRLRSGPHRGSTCGVCLCLSSISPGTNPLSHTHYPAPYDQFERSLTIVGIQTPDRQALAGRSSFTLLKSSNEAFFLRTVIIFRNIPFRGLYKSKTTNKVTKYHWRFSVATFNYVFSPTHSRWDGNLILIAREPMSLLQDMRTCQGYPPKPLATAL